jgi:hemerythrin-like domain-containing protein
MDETHPVPPALMLASNMAPSMSASVIGTIHEEHRTLRMVLQILDRVLSDVSHLRIEPDFKLICAGLYYIEVFPERIHHPKEDDHIFPAIRRRTNRLNATLDALRTDHLRSPHLLRRMQRELVHYQAGAPGGLRRMRFALDAYTDTLLRHMRTEEHVLAAAREYLTDDDWTAIARGVLASEDPLSASAEALEFRRLRARILNMLPRRLRFDMHASEIVRAERKSPADESHPVT